MTGGERHIVVGLGEVKVSKDDKAVLTCLGLGSCVCLAAYDPVVGVGGMAHIVLPKSDSSRGNNHNSKYADAAVPTLLSLLDREGVARKRLIIRIAGGAQMTVMGGSGDVFRIGERNIFATKHLLAGQSLRIRAEDVGGNRGRTMRMRLDSGQTTVTTAGKDCKEL